MLKTRVTHRQSDCDLHTIALPSLIHRIGRPHAQVLKSMADQHHCALKRIRRSRNWQLTGTAAQLSALLESLAIYPQPEAIYFLTDKLRVLVQELQYVALPARLNHLITTDPTTTLAELVQQTGCTLAEARTARERHEWDD